MVHRVYYDTEFIDDGRTIELISIGMVDDHDRMYYAVNADCNFEKVLHHKWLRENVLPHLPTTSEGWDLSSNEVWEKDIIKNTVRDFILTPEYVLDKNPDYVPELWAYFSAFDHVVLSWLWGPMVNMPEGIPFYTHDLKQEMDRLGVSRNDLKQLKTEYKHHALADACWNKEVFYYLEGV